MSPSNNQDNDPNKGTDKDQNGPPKSPKNGNDDANLAGDSSKTSTPKAGGDTGQVTLLDLHRQQQQEKEKLEEERKKAAYENCFKFQICKAVKPDDEGELVVDDDYLESLDKPEWYASMSFDPPLEHRKISPKARGFGKTSLYLLLVFQICWYDFEKYSLKSKIEKALNVVASFEKVLPEDFIEFIEHSNYKTSKILRMKHLTKRIRGYIILTRMMGKYLHDKDEGYDRNPSVAYSNHCDMLPSLHRQMLELDEQEDPSVTDTKPKPLPQSQVSPKSDHFLTQPFTSFKPTANDTWAAIIRKISEAFLTNPFTTDLGQALGIPDYELARTHIPRMVSELSPQQSQAFTSNIKMRICDSLESFKPQANRTELIALPLVDFILKWKDIYSGDRDINQRLRDNCHVLGGIHIVHDGVVKSLTKAARLQQLIRDDFSALPHMPGMELLYFDLFPHLLRPYGNKLHSLDADFYKDLNECTSNQAKIVFLQQRSDLLMKDAEQIDAALNFDHPSSARRTTSQQNYSNHGNYNQNDNRITSKYNVRSWTKCIDNNYQLPSAVWSRLTTDLRETFRTERNRRWPNSQPQPYPTHTNGKRNRDYYGEQHARRTQGHTDDNERRTRFATNLNETSNRPHFIPPPSSNSSLSTNPSRQHHYGPPPPQQQTNSH